MSRWNAPAEADGARPLFYVCLALMFMGFLFGVSMILAGGNESSAPAAPVDEVGGGGQAGGGGGGAFPLPVFPHSPVSTSSPEGDHPAITIVHDVRETMHRLPLDRNNPKGWTNPGVEKRKQK